MNWINHPIILEGNLVQLIPSERSHFEDLSVCAKDARIWQFYAVDGSNPNTLISSLEAGMAERDNGTQYPFVIVRKSDHKIVGSTRFLDIQKEHKKLEIGWTWLLPECWGTAINTECKYLLLSHCFENLKAYRVQIKTDEINIRSRKAIEKIGAKFEGILRNDIVRENGTNRNSAYYSIIDSEWSQTKQNLFQLL